MDLVFLLKEKSEGRLWKLRPEDRPTAGKLTRDRSAESLQDYLSFGPTDSAAGRHAVGESSSDESTKVSVALTLAAASGALTAWPHEVSEYGGRARGVGRRRRRVDDLARVRGLLPPDRLQASFPFRSCPELWRSGLLLEYSTRDDLNRSELGETNMQELSGS